MRAHSQTALLHVCSVLCHPSTPTGCVQATFQSAAQPDSWSQRLQEFAVITESSATTASENLWSTGLALHIMTLFMKLSEKSSGVNTCFILKLTGCFNALSVPDKQRGDASIPLSHQKNATADLDGKQQQNATVFCFLSATSTSSTVYCSHL